MCLGKGRLPRSTCPRGRAGVLFTAAVSILRAHVRSCGWEEAVDDKAWGVWAVASIAPMALGQIRYSPPQNTWLADGSWSFSWKLH